MTGPVKDVFLILADSVDCGVVNWICREFSVGSGDYRASLVLREEILRKPLGLPFRPEDTARDEYSFHLGCYREETLVGVLVLEPLDETRIKMRQVAVAADTQGKERARTSSPSRRNSPAKRATGPSSRMLGRSITDFT